jgi:lipopolysaccharide biosynthesis glycosyltransferase
MNLIYMCVFHNQSYINLLKLLINSIAIKANIKKDTHILIMTSPEFEPLIKNELKQFSLPLIYRTLNLYTLLESSCCKLKIFEFDDIEKYEKILYLDTDVLINSDVNVLFENVFPDKLYALEEGDIGNSCWGGNDFFDYSLYNKNSSAFSAGVFYFMNTISIKELFKATNDHIADYYSKHTHVMGTLDQPFLVYNSFIQNKYENQTMKKYIENNPTTVSNEIIIYHFPGGPGNYSSKYAKMTAFWEKMKTKTDYTELCFLGKKYCVDKSPFFGNHTYTSEYHALLHKRANSIKKVLEIGIGNVELMKHLTSSEYAPGASLRMWRDYFPNAHIFGCDILVSVLFKEDRITTFQVDQSNEASLNDITTFTGNDIDLIIDDGSHIKEHMIVSFNTLWKSVKPGGLYIIEDIHFSFLDTIENLHTRFSDSTCIVKYKGKFESDNFCVFEKKLLI